MLDVVYFRVICLSVWSEEKVSSVDKIPFYKVFSENSMFIL